MRSGAKWRYGMLQSNVVVFVVEMQRSTKKRFVHITVQTEYVEVEGKRRHNDRIISKF